MSEQPANQSPAAPAVPYAALDTEIIRHEGFDFGSKRFELLLRHVKENRIGLLMSEVNEREVRKGIRDRVAEARGALRNKEFQKKVAIIRQLAPFSDLLRDLDQSAVVTELEGRFDAFLRDAEVHIVPAGGANLGHVLDQYFQAQAPFQVGENKKAEFPDAISVHVLAEHIRKLGEQAYFVSGDKGARQAASDTGVLISIERLDELNEKLAIVEANDRERVRRAQAAMKYLEPEVIERLKADFEDTGFMLTSEEEGDVNGVDVASVVVREIFAYEIGEGVAEFTIEADIEYTADVVFDDPSATYFDEGDRYVFNRIKGLATAVEPVTANATINFDAEPSDAELVDLTSDVRDTVEVPLDDFVPTGETQDIED